MDNELLGHPSGAPNIAPSFTAAAVDNSPVAIQQLSVLSALPQPAWIKNRRAEYLFVNDAFAHLLGLPAAQIKGKTDRQLFPKHLHSELVDSDAKVFLTQSPVELEGLRLLKDSQYSFWLSKAPLKDKQGNVNGIVGLMRSSYEAPKDQSSIHYLYEAALKQSNEAVIIADANLHITLVNPAFVRITGFQEQDVLNQPASKINATWLEPEFIESIKHNLKYQGHWEGETWSRKKDGQLYSERIKISVVFDANGQVSHYIGQFLDNTEQKQAQERLEFLAFHDPLTGLANRELFLDRVTYAVQHAKRNENLCAVIYLDLNEFKPINDTYGHPFGDKVLIQAAQRLLHAVRKVDTVSRQGGDEFAVLLEDTTSIENVVLISQKIITSLRQPMVIDGTEVTIGASAGIAVYPDHGDEGSKLIGNADKAMYAAKFLGGNGYYLYK